MVRHYWSSSQPSNAVQSRHQALHRRPGQTLARVPSHVARRTPSKTSRTTYQLSRMGSGRPCNSLMAFAHNRRDDDYLASLLRGVPSQVSSTQALPQQAARSADLPWAAACWGLNFSSRLYLCFRPVGPRATTAVFSTPSHDTDVDNLDPEPLHVYVTTCWRISFVVSMRASHE